MLDAPVIKLLGEVGAEIVDRRIRRGRVGAQRAYAVRLIIQEPERPRRRRGFDAHQR